MMKTGREETHCVPEEKDNRQHTTGVMGNMEGIVTTSVGFCGSRGVSLQVGSDVSVARLAGDSNPQLATSVATSSRAYIEWVCLSAASSRAPGQGEYQLFGT